MNDYLKSAVKRFNDKFKKEFLINPISSIDAEILTEIKQVIKKAGLNEVNAILDEYKFKKDEEIRDDLLQWNIDNPKIGKSVGELVDGVIKEFSEDFEEKSIFPPILTIGSINVRVNDIINWRKFEELGEDDEYIFGILINEIPENADVKNVPIYCNERIVFYSEEERNNVIENLIQFMRSNGTNVIDLNKND